MMHATGSMYPVSPAQVAVDPEVVKVAMEAITLNTVMGDSLVALPRHRHAACNTSAYGIPRPR